MNIAILLKLRRQSDRKISTKQARRFAAGLFFLGYESAFKPSPRIYDYSTVHVAPLCSRSSTHLIFATDCTSET